MRFLALILLVACTDGRVDGLVQRVVPDLHRRIGDLEAARDLIPPPAWWCGPDRCDRVQFEGATIRAWAWCKPDGTGCTTSPERCGERCMGVR